MKDWVGVGFTIAAGLVILNMTTGCTILKEYPRRSELILKVSAHNDPAEPERSADAVLTLHGPTRDILQSYTAALDFTLDKFGLLKK